MLFRLRSLIFAVGVFFTSPLAMAQGAPQQGAVTLNDSSISDGFLMGGHLFNYADKSSLGGNTLKDGSARFIRLDMQYNWTQWFSGIGFFYEQDTFGGDQTDTIIGPVVELIFGSFFFKLMPGQISQKFNGRSFSERTGSYQAFETGIRANLLAGFLFYEVTLHSRTQTIDEEDGRSMRDVYKKTETMPMLGMGVSI